MNDQNSTADGGLYKFDYAAYGAEINRIVKDPVREGRLGARFRQQVVNNLGEPFVTRIR